MLTYEKKSFIFLELVQRQSTMDAYLKKLK